MFAGLLFHAERVDLFFAFLGQEFGIADSNQIGDDPLIEVTDLKTGTAIRVVRILLDELGSGHDDRNAIRVFEIATDIG
jgi:hypothetical protein